MERKRQVVLAVRALALMPIHAWDASCKQGKHCKKPFLLSQRSAFATRCIHFPGPILAEHEQNGKEKGDPTTHAPYKDSPFLPGMHARGLLARSYEKARVQQIAHI